MRPRMRLKKNTYWRGRIAESVAAWSLRLKGWRILASRWSCRQGEVDLIAKKGSVIIFVEVKFRSDIQRALDALTPAQWRRIDAAADIFMARHVQFNKCSWRFDAICVTPWAWPKHFAGIWE